MKLSLAVTAALLATRLAAQDGSGLSASEQSAVRARQVLERGIEAAGGLEALRGLEGVTRTLEGFRVEVGQSHRPDAYTRQPVAVRSILDLKGGRSLEEQRTSVIGGLQIHFVYVNRDGNNGFSLDQTTRIRRPLTAAALSRSRGTPNRYPEFLLRLAWSQLATLRWLGDGSHEGEPQRLVGFADPYGNQLTLWFSARTGLLTKAETLVDEPVFSIWGLRSREVVFSDYRAVQKLQAPFRFVTRYAGELLEDLAVKEVRLEAGADDATFDLPAGFEEAPPPPARGTTTRLAEGVYVFHGGYNSLLVGLEDQVLVVEAPLSDGLTALALARVKELFPGKPVRYVVATHFHRDHIGGLRAYAAAGATLVSTPLTKVEIEKLLRAERPISPDATPPRAAAMETVVGRRTFGNGARRVEVYDIGPSPHVAEMLVAYLPGERILYVADVLDLNPGRIPPAPDDMADFAEKLERLKLEPLTVVPTHGKVGDLSYLRQALAERGSRAAPTSPAPPPPPR